MGGSAAYIALIAAIYGHTGSAAWVSAALFAGVVGSVIGAPGAGWVGDRFDRRLVMIATDLASAPDPLRRRARLGVSAAAACGGAAALIASRMRALR